MPSAVKTTKISPVWRDKAKPTAVPKNGAEQGVASNVANIPDRKWPPKLSDLPTPPKPLNAEGNLTSNQPHRLKANKETMTVIAIRNQGC